jgi:hypothetical protein
MNTTGPKPTLNDPKDYPKNGDIVLPSLEEIAALKKRVEETNHTKTWDDHATEYKSKANDQQQMVFNINSGNSKTEFKDVPAQKKETPFEEQTKENKFWVITSMGFVQRGPARWWHPVLGEDLEWNHLLFDLETDDLKSLTPKLYRTGWAYGQRDLRWKFKTLLDISL